MKGHLGPAKARTAPPAPVPSWSLPTSSRAAGRKHLPPGDGGLGQWPRLLPPDVRWHLLVVRGLLAYASRGTTLRPGDIIGSGTVGTGCILGLAAGHGRDAYPRLEPGDQVRLEADVLGIISSVIRPPVPVMPLRN